MRTLCLALVLVWAGVAATAQPAAAQTSQYIEQIVVTGNQRIEPETIASYMTVDVGDAFDPRQIDDSLKSLFATGMFADVSIRREGDSLIVQVVENPIINRIAFEGNRDLKSEDLEAEVQLRPRTVYTRTKVQNDVARILEIYRRNGHFSATVEPKVIRQEQNRVDLVFEVDEGDPTKVREINFIGNEAYSDGSLREEIATKESAWYRFFTTDDTYDPDRLAFDQELLRRFYLSRGYADFRVLSVVADLTADRRDFFITFTIEEGPRYQFGEVGVISELRGLEPADIEGEVTMDPGDWYDAQEVEDVVQDMTIELGNRGFAFVNVRPRAQRDRENLTVDVNFLVGEGEHVYVEEINIYGNFRTEDEVIRRQFKLAEGDAFNLARLQRSEKLVRELDFFNTVEVTTEPGTQPDTTVINVAVEEKSTGELSIGAGFSTFDSVLFTISIRERNLLGKGQRLSLDLALSSRRQTIGLSFTEPYFLDRDLSAGFDIFKRRLDLQSESSYTQDNIGLVLRMGYPVTEHLRQSLYYTLASTTIEDVDSDASIYIQDQEGTTVTSAVGNELTYDRRNDALNPTSGYLLQFGHDFAGLGGNAKFFRQRGSGTVYYPFAQDWTGSFKLEGGRIFGLFGEDVRIQDRFFLGGASLRGFEPAGVGPRDVDTGDSLGGNIFYAASFELTVPLGLPRELGLTGRLFSDWGSLYSLDEDSITGVNAKNVEDENYLRGSIGIGFAYQSPLGPIRLDFAKDVRRLDYDRTEFFRFSFGTTF
ncbi:MAG: outer membrane protein assembly factor BamA [Proteobacteria bacterium]|nr:outer membrane protein assembly factor BamA [Pseudomonadota bacterium]